jgi:hypothetical protein
MFENKALRIYFINALFAKYNYDSQVKEGEMGRACNTNGEDRNVYRMLVGKSAQMFSSII